MLFMHPTIFKKTWAAATGSITARCSIGVLSNECCQRIKRLLPGRAECLFAMAVWHSIGGDQLGLQKLVAINIKKYAECSPNVLFVVETWAAATGIIASKCSVL